MTMLTQRGAILAKIETNHAAATPDVANNAVEIFDFSIAAVPEMLERDPYRESLDQIATMRGKTYVEVTFQTEFKGSGVSTQKPRWEPLLLSCGFDLTDVSPAFSYFPKNLTLPSCTIWAYVDGICHKVNYCMGSAEFVFEAGQIPKVNWTFRGFYAIPEDIVVPTNCQYDASVPVICMGNNTMEVGDGITTHIVRSFTVNLNNVIASLDDINTASGIKGFVVTARNITGTLILNAETRATANADFWSYWQDRTPKKLRIILDDGKVAGNNLNLYVYAGYFENVTYGDADGIRTMELPFKGALPAADYSIMIMVRD